MLCGSLLFSGLAGESLLLCFLCGSFALGLRLCFVFLAVRSLLGSSLVGFFLCTLVDRNQAVLAYPREDIHQQHAVRETLGSQLTHGVYLVPHPYGRSLAGEVFGTLAFDHHGVTDRYFELMFLCLCLLCRKRRHERSTDQRRCNKN